MRYADCEFPKVARTLSTERRKSTINARGYLYAFVSWKSVADHSTMWTPMKPEEESSYHFALGELVVQKS